MLQAEYQRDQAGAKGIVNGKELIRRRMFLENSALLTEESKKKEASVNLPWDLSFISDSQTEHVMDKANNSYQQNKGSQAIWSH